MAALFNKDRLVFLQAQDPIKNDRYGVPLRAGAMEEYDSSTKKAENRRNLEESTSVAERIINEKFEKIESMNNQNTLVNPEDERSCMDSFYEGTSIKEKCKDKPTSDSIPNPLRRRLLTNFTMDANLYYFKH